MKKLPASAARCESVVQLKSLNPQQKRLVQFHATRLVSSVFVNDTFVAKVALNIFSECANISLLLGAIQEK
jgi:hypothetical protein